MELFGGNPKVFNPHMVQWYESRWFLFGWPVGTSEFQLLELHIGDLNDTVSSLQMAVGDDMWPSRRFYMHQVRSKSQALHVDQGHH